MLRHEFNSRYSPHFEDIMKEEIICSICKKEVEEQVDRKPTWFGEYIKDKLVKVICVECWDKGERF